MAVSIHLRDIALVPDESQLIIDNDAREFPVHQPMNGASRLVCFQPAVASVAAPSGTAN